MQNDQWNTDTETISRIGYSTVVPHADVDNEKLSTYADSDHSSNPNHLFRRMEAITKTNSSKNGMLPMELAGELHLNRNKTVDYNQRLWFKNSTEMTKLLAVSLIDKLLIYLKPSIKHNETVWVRK